MFSDELEKYPGEETTKAIYSKTDADVRRALGKKEHLDVNDLYGIDLTRRHSISGSDGSPQPEKYTMERFGKTISMFVPLYITQFMYQLLCLLWLLHQQSDEKNDSDRRGNHQRI